MGVGRISRGSLLQRLSSFKGRPILLGLQYRSHRGVGTLRPKCLGKEMELDCVAGVIAVGSSVRALVDDPCPLPVLRHEAH